MHWPSPAQRPRITEIHDNLIARIAEAEREGWHGEAEGLKISLAGAATSSPDRRRSAARQRRHARLGLRSHPHQQTEVNTATNPVRRSFSSSENAQRCHDAGRVPSSDQRFVLLIGDVADRVELVLDLPVAADQAARVAGLALRSLVMR